MATAGGWCPLSSPRQRPSGPSVKPHGEQTAPPKRTSRALIATNQLPIDPKERRRYPMPGHPFAKSTQLKHELKAPAETELSPDLPASAAPLRIRRLGLRRHHNHGGRHVRALDRRSARHCKSCRAIENSLQERKKGSGRRAGSSDECCSARRSGRRTAAVLAAAARPGPLPHSPPSTRRQARLRLFPVGRAAGARRALRRTAPSLTSSGLAHRDDAAAFGTNGARRSTCLAMLCRHSGRALRPVR